MTSAEDLPSIISEELARFRLPGTRDAFTNLLCVPKLELRVWDWNRGQSVPVWIVASLEAMDLMFAYSREGYGDPWGVLSSTGNSLGSDAEWHAHLEDAFVTSGAWKGQLPPDYEIQ